MGSFEIHAAVRPEKKGSAIKWIEMALGDGQQMILVAMRWDRVREMVKSLVDAVSWDERTISNEWRLVAMHSDPDITIGIRFKPETRSLVACIGIAGKLEIKTQYVGVVNLIHLLSCALAYPWDQMGFEPIRCGKITFDSGNPEVGAAREELSALPNSLTAPS